MTRAEDSGLGDSSVINSSSFTMGAMSSSPPTDSREILTENLVHFEMLFAQQVETIQQLQDDKRIYHGTLVSLQQECHDQKDTILSLQQDKQKLQGETLGMERKCNEQKHSVQNLQQANKKLKDHSARLEAALEHQQQESHQLRENSARLEAQLREQLEHRQQESDQHRENSARLEVQLREQLEHQQQESHQRRDLLARLKAALQHQQQESHQFRENSARLEAQLREQLEHQQQESHQLRDHSARLEAALQHQQQESHQLREVFEVQCREKDTLLQQLQQKIRQLEDETEAVSSQLREKERLMHGIMDVIANNTAEKERAVAENQSSLNRLQVALRENQRFQENLERQESGRQAELSNCRRQRDTLQLNIIDALNQVKEKNTTLVNSQETHVRERRELRGRISELNDELEQLQTSSQRQIVSLTQDGDKARAECNRLTGAVEDLEAEKRQWLEDKEREEEEIRLREREHDELITECKVLQRRIQTAEEQSIRFGEETTTLRVHAAQLQTAYAEIERQSQNATTADRELEYSLRDQLRVREQQVVPLEIEARRATLEMQNIRTQMETLETEKKNLETTVAALREEVQRSVAVVSEFERREAHLRQENSDQHHQNLRYIKEKQDCQCEIRALLDEVNCLRKDVQRSVAVVSEFERREAHLRQENSDQHHQKLRYIKEKQDCQSEIRALLDEVNRLRMRCN